MLGAGCEGAVREAGRGEISGLTGVDDPYEAPADPDLRIETHRNSVQESAAEVRLLLSERGLL
ncbi:hypothetical protein GCM10017744_031420 [Streptomyces antimycoticus]